MMTVTEAGIDPEAAFRPLVDPASERWWERDQPVLAVLTELEQDGRRGRPEAP